MSQFEPHNIANQNGTDSIAAAISQIDLAVNYLAIMDKTIVQHVMIAQALNRVTGSMVKICEAAATAAKEALDARRN